MQTRLLAFLAETQRAICAERSEPRPGSAWEASRSVNYALGLARLNLASKEFSGKTSSLGSLLLQSFKLADGTLCLKANLSWPGSTADVSRPIYAKPGLDWEEEARALASLWLSGPPADVVHVEREPELLAAG
jgi:hypothetical protein